jgi:hypothetical protein
MSYKEEEINSIAQESLNGLWKQIAMFERQALKLADAERRIKELEKAVESAIQRNSKMKEATRLRPGWPFN